jgi:putative transposase
VYGQERKENIVSIGAYCLMPNHFHLLLTSETDIGISEFMRKLTTGYTMYFNKRNDRTGALFQGTFKSKHADSDEYLKYLFSYIHLNPREVQGFDYKSYPYSSLINYLVPGREETAILDKVAFPEYFSNKQDVLAEINEWYSYTEG